jgi:hypothetical protein
MPEVSNERMPLQSPTQMMSKVVEDKENRLVEKLNLPKNAKKISLIRDDVDTTDQDPVESKED